MKNMKQTLALSSAITALIGGKIGCGPVDHDVLRTELAEMIGGDPVAADFLDQFNYAYGRSDLDMDKVFEQVISKFVAPYLADVAMRDALTCVTAAMVFADYECCHAEIAKKIRIVYGDDDNSGPGKQELTLRPTWMKKDDEEEEGSGLTL
jgi:hypothetical protein